MNEDEVKEKIYGDDYLIGVYEKYCQTIKKQRALWKIMNTIHTLTAAAKEMDIERQRVHTELLKRLGCESPMDRDHCNQCLHCIKTSLAMFTEQTIQEEQDEI